MQQRRRESRESRINKNRRQKEEENPELFKKVLDEAISRIESEENNKKNKKMAEEIRKKYLKKYAYVFKEKLERGDKIKCQPV